MPGRHDAGHTCHPGGRGRINGWRRIVQMDHIGPRLFEDAIEIPRGLRQVAAHIRLHGEALGPHPLAQRAQCQDRVDARIMALLALQAAQLRDQRLGAAHLHAVDYVRDFHAGCLNLRPLGAKPRTLFPTWKTVKSTAFKSMHHVHDPEHDVHYEDQQNRQNAGVRQYARQPQARRDHPLPQSHLENHLDHAAQQE